MLRISDLASIELISGFMVPGAWVMASTSSSLANAGKAKTISAAASDVTRRNMAQHRRIRPVARQLSRAYPADHGSERRTDRLHGAHAALLSGARLRQRLRLGAFPRGAVHAAQPA